MSIAQSHNWFVYLILCNDLTLYTGITCDLNRRVRQHNGDLVGGARYTRSRRPVKLIWWEAQRSRGNALQREAEIKSSTHEEKWQLALRNA